METYQERVGRYRILRHEEMSEQRKAEYRLNGIDPDDLWTLVWSFDDEDKAKEQLARCIETKAECSTYILRDNGEASIIERPYW